MRALGTAALSYPNKEEIVPKPMLRFVDDVMMEFLHPTVETTRSLETISFFGLKVLAETGYQHGMQSEHVERSL